MHAPHIAVQISLSLLSVAARAIIHTLAISKHASLTIQKACISPGQQMPAVMHILKAAASPEPRHASFYIERAGMGCLHAEDSDAELLSDLTLTYLAYPLYD